MKSRDWPSDVFIFFLFPKPLCQNHQHLHIVPQVVLQILPVPQGVQFTAVKKLSSMRWTPVRIIVVLAAAQTVLIVAAMLLRYQLNLCVHQSATPAAISPAQRTVVRFPLYHWLHVQVTVHTHVTQCVRLNAAHRSITQKLQKRSRHAARFARAIVFLRVQKTAAG